MKITSDNSDSAVLKEIGNRIAQYRLNQNKTQAALAQEAGISNRTMTRVEHGHSVQASSLVRILRALKLTGNIDRLIPEPVVSPVQQFKMRGKQRKRASSEAAKPDKESTWTWGDEE
ncbi:MAG: helix-turn-helix transcriptional regulator [Gammaproteobacteria bacterium]|nr:helix-turn-helix transcriptional regulator [Gammaproteobacteria bacterium]